VQLKSNEIEYLKTSEVELKTQLAEMKSEAKIKSEEIEYLKMESKDNKKNLEFEVQLKSTEIEYLKKSKAELETQLAEMKSVVKAKSEDIENLKV
ncbi:hypothetical protein PENTCL1PPCAC_12979, partial [Pristionchus entomophagus]